jgi:transcriptional regulator with XRE-family HTH domain
MSELSKRIGRIIRKARLEHSLSQEKLAEMVDVSGKYIGMLERGEKSPSVQFLEKISRTLGISIGFFADAGGEKKSGVSAKQNKLIRQIYEMESDQVEAMLVVADMLGKYRIHGK